MMNHAKTAFSRIALLAAVAAMLVAAPTPAAAQQERVPMSFDDLVELVDRGIRTATILRTVQDECLSFFDVTDDMERNLMEVGAERRLIEGLRNICRVSDGRLLEPSSTWVLVTEPREWGREDPGTLTFDAGREFRITGRANDPSGVRSLEVDGVPAELANDPGGGVRFSGFVTVAAGARGVEIVLHPEEGEPHREVLPLHVRGDDAPAADAPDTGPGGGAPARTYNAGTTALSGLLVPGLPQFRTGNSLLGVVFLGAAAGAVATGFLSETTTIRCAADADPCPEAGVLGETSEREYLVPAIGAAAGLAVLSAVLGYSAAQSANEAAAARQRDAAAAAVRDALAVLRRLPTPRADGGWQIELARFRVR